MPENKRQHYVPKHALKRFAADQDGKQINLVHISSRKVIRGASLREQCYRDYFYGSNLEIERTLSLMESSQSKLIEKIVAAEKLDPFDAGAITLIFALQRSRTLRAETEMSEMVESLMKTAMYGRFEETTLRNVRIGLEHGAGLNIRTALLMAPLLHDLRQVLIVNRTSVPFVLSDSPVITTNWFCRYRHPERHSTGVSMSGLQMLLPISPSLAILLLDRGVYSTEAIGGKVSLQKPADVHHLNSLQWLGALKTMYFPPTLPESSVDALVQTKRPNTGLFRYERLERVGESNAFRKTDKDEYDGPSPGVTSELVSLHSEPIPLDIRFAGLRIRSKPRLHDNGSMASPLRDPVWGTIIRDFATAVTSRQVTYDQMFDFIERHPLQNQIGPWRLQSVMKAVRSRKMPGQTEA